MGSTERVTHRPVWHPIPRLTPGAFMGNATAIHHAPYKPGA
jgi:hypothetical protein